MESSEVLYDPEQHDPGIRLWAVLPDPAPSARADGGQLAAGEAAAGEAAAVGCGDGAEAKVSAAVSLLFCG